MPELKTLGLFFITALAEIFGCYLPWRWLVDGVRPTLWDLLGSAVVLAGLAIIMFSPRPV